MTEPDLPAWWGEAADKRVQNRRSAQKERKVAKETGGRVQAGSGSSWSAPREIVTDEAMIQHKYTDAKGYRLDSAEWEEIRTDALQAGREPAMIVEFTRTGRRLLITEMQE